MNRLPVFNLIVNVSFMSVSTRRIPEALMLRVINEGPRGTDTKPFSSNRTGRINFRLKWTPYARLLRLLRYISQRRVKLLTHPTYI